MNMREEKKAATRLAISESAATLLLEDGMSALTVARVSERAGVSPRTFHNYFADIDEALLEFVGKVFRAIAEQIDALPPEFSAVEALETIVLDSIDEEGSGLYSASTLIILVEQARLGSSRPPAKEAVKNLTDPLVESIRRRFPGATRFDAEVLLTALGTAGATAVDAYRALPEPREASEGRALVRRAFELLREAH